MRTMLITMLVAGGIGLVGTSSTLGLPVNGDAIAGAVQESSMMQNVAYCNWRGRNFYSQYSCRRTCVTGRSGRTIYYRACY